MTGIEYAYCVIRYRHDPSAGELLNIGVAAYSPATGQVGLRVEHTYSRLSETFARFDPELHRQVLERLRAGLHQKSRQFADNLFQLQERAAYRDVTSLVREIWPDQGLSYQVGPAMVGFCDDLSVEIEDLFDRFVASQSHLAPRRERRSDEEVWEGFRKLLSPRGITSKLSPIKLGKRSVEFKHAFRNEKVHVIEPVSLDYIDPARVKERAYRTIGKAFELRDEKELGTMYLLLGRPASESALERYDEVVEMLHDIPTTKQIVDEKDAERFADQLESEMRVHGLID